MLPYALRSILLIGAVVVVTRLDDQINLCHHALLSAMSMLHDYVAFGPSSLLLLTLKFHCLSQSKGPIHRTYD